jgi:hypothetical protein
MLPRLELTEDPSQKNDFIIFRKGNMKHVLSKTKTKKTNKTKKTKKIKKTRKYSKSKSIFSMF